MSENNRQSESTQPSNVIPFRRRPVAAPTGAASSAPAQRELIGATDNLYDVWSDAQTIAFAHVFPYQGFDGERCGWFVFPNLVDDRIELWAPHNESISIERAKTELNKVYDEWTAHLRAHGLRWQVGRYRGSDVWRFIDEAEGPFMFRVVRALYFPDLMQRNNVYSFSVAAARVAARKARQQP